MLGEFRVLGRWDGGLGLIDLWMGKVWCDSPLFLRWMLSLQCA